MINCDEKKPYIFVSYSHRNSEKVIEIMERMCQEGYNVWYDGGIDPGTEWDENIANHVNECSYFISFISEGYLGSSNCKDALNYARDLDKEQILVYLEDVKLPDDMAMRLIRLQAILWYDLEKVGVEEAYRKLFSAKGIEKTRNMGAYATEETPAEEEVPTAEETPAVEEAPAVEDVPVAEEVPVVEEVPVAEEAPVAVEEVPVTEEAPVVAEMPVYEAPVQPVSNMVQPQNSAVKPVKEKKAKTPKAPNEKKAKKKVWPLLLVLVGVAAIAVIVAFALGLFEKKTIRVEDTSVTVVVGEEYSVSVLNYKDIGKPELTWTVEDDSIAEVEFSRGSATIIGLEEGTTDIVVSGPWCKERTIHVTVVLFELEGASFESFIYEYYFLEDGTYYIFSKTLMDHYTGEYSMEEYEKEDVVDLGLEFLNEEDVSEMLDRVEDGVFFIIELDGVNYYNGYAFKVYGYQTMCICTNGEDTYTCSSFSYYKAETSEIPMEDEDDLEERVYGTN